MANEWTTEYPTEPGYYWIRNYRIRYGTHPPGPNIPGPEIVEVDEKLDYITWSGDEVGIYRRHLVSAEWLGPIQPPGLTERELLTKFLDYIYHLLANKSACYVAIDSFLQIRMPPEDKPSDQLTELFHNSLTNRGKQVLANQAVEDLDKPLLKVEQVDVDAWLAELNADIDERIARMRPQQQEGEGK